MTKMKPPQRCRYNGKLIDPDHQIAEHRSVDVREVDVTLLLQTGWSIAPGPKPVSEPIATIDDVDAAFDADEED